MSEQRVLNPSTTWDDLIQDNLCPDYGFGAKLPNTRVNAKAPGGQPFSREVQNSGHTFSLSWLNRSFACTQVLKQFYEQYADGYFTLIDHDGGGRPYVGRFTGDFNRTQNGNDSYDVRDLQFEEVPGAPMLQYPSDWQRDSIKLYPFNDFGTQLVSSGQGEWSARTDLPGPTAFSHGGNAGDFFCMEYRGYGFQLYMRTGSIEGEITITVDGTLQATVDLNNANPSAGPVMVYSQAQLSLDLHRVKVATTGAHNNTGVTFHYLQVMR